MISKTMRGAGLWACALGILALFACGSGERTPTRGFHVIVISMDGWQAGESTPNLSQFLEISTGFEGLQAAVGSTARINASVFTGLTPEELGVASAQPNAPILAPEETLFPEYLIDHGYRTAAVVSTDSGMTPESGLAQGFDDYQLLPGTAEELSVLAEDWIGRHKVQPFFVFLQFPSAEGDAAEVRMAQADEALGGVLRSLGTHGLLDSSLVVLTGNQGATRMLQIKAPGQQAALTDYRPVKPYHMPRLLLQYMSLPVAAVRPNSYLSHPIEAVAKDGNL